MPRPALAMVMLARLGYAVKGILYIVIGVLAAMLGLGMAGPQRTSVER